MQLVEDQSRILFSQADLLDQNNIQTIAWSQSLKSMMESFVQILATLTADQGSKVVFFVQQSLAEKLLSASLPSTESRDDYEAIVQAPMFRFGQDRQVEPTFRFLVYLDPSYNIDQPRFINQTTVSKLAALAAKEPDLVPYASAAKELCGLAPSLLGSPLCCFEG